MTHKELLEAYNNLVDDYEDMRVLAFLAAEQAEDADKLRKENKRLKAQVKRHKDKPATKPNPKVKQLEDKLLEHQKVVAQAAIYIGSYTNDKGIQYDVYDNQVRKLTTPDGEMNAHQLFVINEYGNGKLVYRLLGTDSSNYAKGNNQTRFYMSKGLEEYIEGYYDRIHDRFNKAKAALNK